MLADVLKFMLCWVLAVLLLSSLPFVFCALYGEGEEPRQDEQWWLEQGYPPLDASSTGEGLEEEEDF